MIVEEGSCKLEISEGKITKKLPVFYNPVMKMNRDISVLLLNSVPDKDLQIADPLAGSGIRAVRFLKELKKGKILNISINDYKTADNIRKNLKLNNLKESQDLMVFSGDANRFMLDSKGFDYIDIDPFGSPNPFLDAAIVRLARGGILAVTATDTSALAGSSPTACMRKYWAKPLRNELMHEIGIRILIRKVQLIGSQNEKALVPIYSYAKEHYYRIFFRCEKGRQKADEIFKEHGYLLYDPKALSISGSKTIFNKKECDYAGPLWLGDLWDEDLAVKIADTCEGVDKELKSFLSTIAEESRIHALGFYDLHKLSNLKKKENPRIDSILSEGKVSRTHFLGWGVRSKDCPKF